MAALAQVALALGALARVPPAALFGAAAAANVAIAAFWLAAEGPQAVSAVTTGIGVALSAVAVLLGVLAVWLGRPLRRAGRRARPAAEPRCDGAPTLRPVR